MKKITAFSLLIIIFNFSCDTLKGHRGINNSLDKSKKNQTFVKGYKISNNNIKLPELYAFGDIWVEKDWYHGGFYDKNRIGNYFRIIMKIKIDNHYDTTWCIGMENKDFFEHNHDIIHYFLAQKPKDTLNLVFYRKENLIIKDSIKINLISYNP